jgi:hypothetical protein
LEGINQNLSFGRQLVAFINLLEVATAADAEMGTWRKLAKWRGLNDFRYERLKVTLSIPNRPDQDLVSRGRKRYENGPTFV